MNPASADGFSVTGDNDQGRGSVTDGAFTDLIFQNSDTFRELLPLLWRKAMKATRDERHVLRFHGQLL